MCQRGVSKQEGSPQDETAKPPELLAVNLIKNATAYVESARHLNSAPGGATRFFNPKYFLLCHAIELTLKAHLAASGVPEHTLRKIGHDLKKAFTSARRFKFEPADPRWPQLVRWLAPFHLDHVFRYPKALGYVRFPSVPEAAEIILNTAWPVDAYVRSQFKKMKSRQARLALAKGSDP